MQLIKNRHNGREHPLFERDEWGARKPRHRGRMGRHSRRVGHYTVTSSGGEKPSLAFGFASMRAVQSFHMDGRGWSDFAYNFAVDNSGRIYVGRGLGTTGGHTQGYNSTAYAVVWIGQPGDPFTDDAKSAIRAIMDYIDDAYSVDTTVFGHRELGSTACPGDEYFTWIKKGMPSPGGGAPSPHPPAETEEFEVNQQDEETIRRIVREEVLVGVIALTGSQVTDLRKEDVLGTNDIGALTEKLHAQAQMSNLQLIVNALGVLKNEGVSLDTKSAEELANLIVSKIGE